MEPNIVQILILFVFLPVGAFSMVWGIFRFLTRRPRMANPPRDQIPPQRLTSSDPSQAAPARRAKAIFLSYASEDITTAQKLAAAL
jgi:hypothetical protein